MATAEELLGGDILTIDLASRIINIPSSVKALGAVTDDKVHKLKFALPRHYGDVDFSTFDIKINYQNANGDGDVAAAGDIEITDEVIYFTWLVGRFAFVSAGSVSFGVEAKETDSNGTILREFNTTDASLPVLESKNTAQATVEAERDAIAVAADEAIKRALDSELKGDPGYTPVKGTDYFTPTEREEFADLVVNDAQGVFANAVKGTASGEIIRVDDVSPVEHTVKARVHGKNIIPYPYHRTSYTGHGGTFTVQSDGGIIASGTPTDYVSLYLYSGKPLAMSGNIVFSASGEYDNVSISMAIYDINDTILFTKEAWKEAAPIYVNLDNYPTAAKWLVFVKRSLVNIEMTGTIYPQIEFATVPTGYEPYVDPASVTLTRCGKNLFEQRDNSQAVNGVTVTSNDDGSITYNGTATGTILSYLIQTGRKRQLCAGKYVISVGTKMPDKCALIFEHYNNNNWLGVIGRITATLHENVNLTERSGNLACYIKIDTGAILNNFTVYPQLEVGEVETKYEAPCHETYTPGADGTVDIVSTSPTMTLTTDTDGATIECEYSRDTGVVIASLAGKIAELESKINSLS